MASAATSSALPFAAGPPVPPALRTLTPPHLAPRGGGAQQYPRAQHRHHHAHPHHAAPPQQRRPHSPYTSLAPTSATPPARHPHPQHRTRTDRERERSYDPDFDRAPTQPVASSSARELFNPQLHAQAQSHGHPRPLPPPADPSRLRRDHREESGARRPRSKREPVDPNDLGRRAGSGSGIVASRSGAAVARGDGSKESLESVETDFSGRTRSSGAAGGGRRRRRREDGDGPDEAELPGAGAGAGAAGAAGKSRQLFDPRRDDPMRFAEVRTERAARNGSKGVAADARSLASGSVLSFASDATGEHATADDAASIMTSGSAPPAGAAHSKRAPHPAMAPLKRAYREITDLEARVQEEHRAAQAASHRGGEADEPAKGLRIQGGAGAKRFDDEYWVKLASLHKQLADAHYSFLQLALDPRLPASLHSLAQRYNIPTRLWQVAFHQLLERMRHAVLSAPHPSTADSSSAQTNVLEHLIEFIQYAYGHYSQLFEDPAIAVFRAAWIEQLGDLARYRMAVAGLASRMHAASASASSGSARLTSAALDGATARAALRPADAASIGQAALGDWELEEQETWREIARDWYGQGLAENPGTGRLQHHLALLSKGDEMRALYHYVKSLTAAHPYVSARESILPLFEDEHQARRTQPDVTKAELFVHLHGMLFTKIALDDFAPALDRFLERLQEEKWALGKARDDWAALGQGSAAPFGDGEWFLLGVINIGALLQYGADDAVLNKILARDAPEDAPAAGAGAGDAASIRSNRHGRGGAAASKHGTSSLRPPPGVGASRAAPQAIMVKRSDADGGEPAALEDEPSGDAGAGVGDHLVKQLRAPSGVPAPEDDPLVFKLAQQLSFTLLEFLIDAPFRSVGTAVLPNPYVTLLVTFLAHLSHHPAALAHLERAVPWAHLAALFNRLPAGVEVRLDAPAKIGGGRPLPEDWCLRGMDWAGRQLFGRGYWREHRPRATPGGSPEGAGEGAPAATHVESELDALRFDLGALLDDPAAASSAADEAPDGVGFGGGAGAAAQLAESRWRRLAVCAAWLVRNVPGFDFGARAPDPARRFAVSGVLRDKVARWASEDADAREAERLSRLALEERGGSAGEEGAAEEEESGDEDDEDEDDSEAVRELKARRRQLKSIIRSARSATRGAAGKVGGGLKAKFGGKAALPKVFPGYTVLVFDTNILLTSIELFSELVAAECWTIVVPLAVITELDGLRRNANALGVAASEVIDYLELAVRSYSRHLKIQTSRGNYLKDLAIRNESIDFGGGDDSGSGAHSHSHDVARTMDDVILRAVAWQRDHFTNRVALVHPQAVLDRRRVPADAAHVVLVTFDRNLRLKAGARGLDATDEKGLRRAVAVAMATSFG